jgi:hypothetical protein
MSRDAIVRDHGQAGVRDYVAVDVVQKVPLPGYTENRRSRARKGIRCLEWNLDLNHALVAGGWRGGRDARRVRMDVCTNAPGARRDSNMAADTYLLRDSMQTEQTAPDDTLDADLSLEAEQWERDNAAVRAEFLRRRQAEIEDRRQFGKPINPAMLARIMGAWVSASLESRV